MVDHNLVAGTPVPWTFLTDPALLGSMVRRRDERALDAMLYLWKLFARGRTGSLALRYDAAAKLLGMADMGREGYRRQINKTLRKLDAVYRLIDAETAFGGDARIALRRGRTGRRGAARISEKYWDYGWNKILRLRGKTAYLINVAVCLRDSCL